MADETNVEGGMISPKMKKGLSLTGKGAIGLSIPAIITALITMMPGILSDIREQRKEQKAGYDSLAPTVLDLQSNSEEFLKWTTNHGAAEGKHEETIDTLKKENWKLEQRIFQIELALQSRRIRVAPAAAASAMPSPMVAARVVIPPPKIKAKRPVPKNIRAAADYQQQRVEKHCPKNDPLCGFE
jgi:hypothetical protein